MEELQQRLDVDIVVAVVVVSGIEEAAAVISWNNSLHHLLGCSTYSADSYSVPD